MHLKLFATLLLASATLFAGCSDPNPDAPQAGQVHPAGWVCLHAAEADTQEKLQGCTSCHGPNFEGSGQIPACSSCHAYNGGPPFTLHPPSWDSDAFDEHRHFHNIDFVSWTTCAVSACHGTTLRGGQEPCPTGPSCFSASQTLADGSVVTCHDTGPLPNHQRPPYVDPDLHGHEAKDGNNTGSNQLVCRNCHGRPPNTFDGGFVADPAIINNPNGNCSAPACHPAAKAHPTNWQGGNDAADPFDHFSTHRTVSQRTVDQGCALCHNTVSAGAGPFPNAPSCFSSNFTNSEGSTSGCHLAGPGVAPHAVPFTDPDLHGPAAKSDLLFCQGCHGEQGGAGSNPRFNVPVGNLANGCEDCHDVNTAHPVTDRWTFRGLATSTRRTHFAVQNPTNACGLCHGANLDGDGGNAFGPSCFSCHLSAPQFDLNCISCHGTPPPGAGPDLTGGVVVDHVAGFNAPLDTVPQHEQCGVCHGSNDDGAGNLVSTGPDYRLFNRLNQPLAQGGDHLDGQIEMNGPVPATGAAYNEADFGCDNACHPNDAAHQLSDSGLAVAFGNYGTGSGGCITCHGYPPTDLTPDINPVVVDHDLNRQDGGAFLLANHNDCVVCHGNKDDGTGSHFPVAPYDLATDHQDGNIEMNGPTGTGAGYNEVNFGCDNACHPNDGPHQLSDSGLLVEPDDYGGGGGAGACDACHTTGVIGAPIVITGGPHAPFICEDCHTAHNTGLGDPNIPVVIPNNPAVGINYSANGEAGISLGGLRAPGGTEAEICWGCHDSMGLVSEWGQNINGVTGNSNYDYGQIFADAGTITPTSNWVNAFWKSAMPSFAYKTAQVQSTHAANSGAATAGVDAVADIRCSYCHDVHDLNRAVGDAVSGQPYLRGTWMGNPYLEDGAPQNGATYAQTRFGRVPRGSNSSIESGGYQIDQNNGDPTAGWTADSSAGLCELCHGSGDGIWAAGEIDTLNTFGAAASAWIGTNGHANATLGGSGAGATNLFRTSDRNSSPVVGGNAGAGNPSMAYQNIRPTDSRGFGFRSNASDPDGWNLNPRLQNNGEPQAFDFYNWGASVDEGSTDNQYHRFSCSKCHNPHASRLPRLMITNCLDTKQNTWDNGAGIDVLPAAGTRNQDGSDTISAENANVTFSNATSAQNCHRLKDPAFGNALGSGWNFVTPWGAVGSGQDNPGIQ